MFMPRSSLQGLGPQPQLRSIAQLQKKQENYKRERKPSTSEMPLIPLVNCVHIVSCVGKDLHQLERLQMNVTSVTHERKV